MKLVCDENIVGLEALAAHCEVTALPGRRIGRADLADCDVLWVRSVTPVDAHLLDGTPVRFVGTATAGTEHVDTDYLAARGIRFAAAPGANANAVVEYVINALATLEVPWLALDGGATLGIVGFGNVGRRLYRVARALGWRVRVCDPWVQERAQGEGSADTPEFTALGEILECAVISLHCALHDRAPWPSRHLIDGRALAGLGASQWLLNAARGAVLDNRALLDRLQADSPPSVVLDVWEGEPAFDARLFSCPSLRLGTPHIAGYSWDAKLAASRALADATPGLGADLLDAAGGGLPALACPGADSAPAFARQLLVQRHDLRADDARLRGVASAAAGGAVEASFDALRRDYPLRRELRGSRLAHPTRMALPAREAERILVALGVEGALERETGFEPATSTLARLRSTN